MAKLDQKNITVLGSGSWGTALADYLAKCGHSVLLWGRSEAVLEEIGSSGRNTKYFPGVELSRGITPEADLSAAIQKSEIIVLAIPSSAYLEMAKEIVKSADNISKTYIITSKGLEKTSFRLLSAVLEDELGESAKVSVLSGPSFAKELIENRPTAAVLAAKDESLAKELADVFHSKTLRVYTSSDVTGVQLCGAIKNIIALAIGIVDGRKIGLNARAAILTRGLVEMKRVVEAFGGKEATVYGLSGLGDLVLTSTGDLSRNRQVGLRLGRGESPEEILSSLGQVSEGAVTAEKILALAKEKNLELPIVEEVVEVLNSKRSIDESIANLLNRPIAGEG